ncbi:glycosyltransferase family 2 protein [Ornithinimicrobium panacihumi]|uniref:glycosyltransferase family 2 protein n=1 Tax=Ornithinimicrobium panacihumi TaxID=2008449 RepID=UPI003F890AD5
MTDPTLTVCIVTYERSSFLSRCLAGLAPEADQLSRVVVVDASAAASPPTGDLEVGDLRYIHAPELAGWMTRSRNRALLEVDSDLVAFLDDDVVVRPGWARELKSAFQQSGADAVAGRTCDGHPGEEVAVEPIGLLKADGRLSAGFAADTSMQDVDHGIGANMSFTREVLRELGGFRDDYPGTALREDTDMFLRVKQLGRRAVFAPGAVVDHLPAPHVRGSRFDTRYKLYGRRNHLVLLTRHSGISSQLPWRWVGGQFQDVLRARGLRRKAERLGVVTLGVGFGLSALPRTSRWGPTDPRRSGPAADRIRAALSPSD